MGLRRATVNSYVSLVAAESSFGFLDPDPGSPFESSAHRVLPPQGGLDLMDPSRNAGTRGVLNPTLMAAAAAADDYDDDGNGGSNPFFSTLQNSGTLATRPPRTITKRTPAHSTTTPAHIPNPSIPGPSLPPPPPPQDVAALLAMDADEAVHGGFHGLAFRRDDSAQRGGERGEEGKERNGMRG
eukprot:CAMPEP_0175083574 /NCGR_PEP_ID=MMETSP0052_2-20121109/27477_1 /TAXON_ID=51329 ORGANISM="Polytomella parva, Strain SAG 63-3" /NCGR_SAMPLE_ID=MMETSP0052_2 /ASSEMBLY_ACC=CAM_ASM_000194 /LENGTH=183 /DNA_ID=CAMNT_0016355077 /DNA_START=52 /DNA_END=600 /DNA_ORIENTATION=+